VMKATKGETRVIEGQPESDALNSSIQ
jgi:hypothetical protein